MNIAPDSEKSEFNAMLNKIKHTQFANFDNEYVRNYDLLKKQAEKAPSHIVESDTKVSFTVEPEVKVEPEPEKKPRKQMTPEAKAAAAQKRANTIAAKKAAATII